MIKDREVCELTKDEAIRLHREMWTDMQKKLGDKPNPGARAAYKQNWLKRHGYEDVEAYCFLCEYAQQAWQPNGGAHGKCGYCPIDWSSLRNFGLKVVGKCYERYKNGGGEIYEHAPISEILALPERKANNDNA